MKCELAIIILIIIVIVLGIDYYFYRVLNLSESSTNNNLNYLNKYFDQVYVITLPNRKSYIQSVMREINLSCHYFPAVLKNKLNKENLISSRFLSPKNNLNDGQIACHLSHISVLKKFLKSGANNCLIFEDDLKTPEVSNTTIFSTMNSIPKDYDIIYLGRCWDSCRNTIELNNYVVKCYSPQCRHAYGVSRKGAEKIIKYSQPLVKAGDATISEYIKRGQIIAYAPKKSFFFQNREQLGSNLNNTSIQRECV